MTISFIFWFLMLLVAIFGFYFNRDSLRGGNYAPFGGSVILFVLLFLLGWRVFNWPIQG